MRKLKETQETRTHTHTHPYVGWARGMKEGSGSRAAFVSTVARTRKQLCVFDRFNRPFLSVLLYLYLSLYPFPHSVASLVPALQQLVASQPSWSWTAVFFTTTSGFSVRALCARFSTTAAAGFVPDVGNFCFAFCFSSARLFFFSIYSLRFALLRSSLVTDFRIFNFAVMVMEREREREVIFMEM